MAGIQARVEREIEGKDRKAYTGEVDRLGKKLTLLWTTNVRKTPEINKNSH